MPRNPSTGTYTLPSGYLAVPNTPILADAQHNDLFTDIQTVLNEAWPFGTSGGSIAAANGSVGLPSISFASDVDTGWYRVGANNIGMSLGGVVSWNYTQSSTTYTWADNGAAVGPTLDLFRDSASPAASDVIGDLAFSGRNSNGTKWVYASIFTTIADPTAVSEDAFMTLQAVINSTTRDFLYIGANAAGTANASATGLPRGQLSFPATQNPSSDVNTLDDYEEGTWTPVIEGTSTAGAGTYSVQTGTFTKIGRLVYATASLSWSAHTGTGNMQVTGFPFSAVTVTYSAPVLANGLTITGFPMVNLSGTTGAIFAQNNGTLASIAMDTSVTTFNFTIIYQAA